MKIQLLSFLFLLGASFLSEAMEMVHNKDISSGEEGFMESTRNLSLGISPLCYLSRAPSSVNLGLLFLYQLMLGSIQPNDGVIDFNEGGEAVDDFVGACDEGLLGYSGQLLRLSVDYGAGCPIPNVENLPYCVGYNCGDEDVPAIAALAGLEMLLFDLTLNGTDLALCLTNAVASGERVPEFPGSPTLPIENEQCLIQFYDTFELNDHVNLYVDPQTNNFIGNEDFLEALTDSCKDMNGEVLSVDLHFNDEDCSIPDFSPQPFCVPADVCTFDEAEAVLDWIASLEAHLITPLYGGTEACLDVDNTLECSFTLPDDDAPRRKLKGKRRCLAKRSKKKKKKRSAVRKLQNSH